MCTSILRLVVFHVLFKGIGVDPISALPEADPLLPLARWRSGIVTLKSTVVFGKYSLAVDIDVPQLNLI